MAGKYYNAFDNLEKQNEIRKFGKTKSFILWMIQMLISMVEMNGCCVSYKKISSLFQDHTNANN